MYVWVSVSNQRIKYSGGAVHFLHWMTESCSLPVLCYCCACCPCADFNPGAIKVLVPFFLFPTDARQFCMVSKRHLGLQSPTPRFRYDCRIKGSLALTFPTKNWSRVNRSIFGRFDVIDRIFWILKSYWWTILVRMQNYECSVGCWCAVWLRAFATATGAPLFSVPPTISLSTQSKSDIRIWYNLAFPSIVSLLVRLVAFAFRNRTELTFLACTALAWIHSCCRPWNVGSSCCKGSRSSRTDEQREGKGKRSGWGQKRI